MLSAHSPSLDASLWPLQYVLLVSSMGIIFGCDLGTLFINQDYLSNLYLISINRSHVVIGTYVLGFIFGTFISGYVTYGSGRKLSLVSSGLIGTFAILASIVAPNFAIFLCAEFVIGFSFGLYIVAACLYNNEISHPRWRSLSLVLLPDGIILGGLLSLITYTNPANKPFIVFITLVIFNLILMAFTIMKLPESPRFLAVTGSTDAALSVLFKLRHDMGVAARELAEINECCRGENRGLEFYMQNAIYRRLLGLMCISIFILDLGGIFIIPYALLDNLSLRIFCPEENYCYFTLNSALIYTSFTLIFVSFILHTLALERFSRRFIILISLSATFFFLALATFTTLFAESDLKNYALTIFILCFIFFGLGGHTSLICVLVPEILPIRGREFGLAVIFLTHGIGLLFSLQTYMPAIHQLGFSVFLAIMTALLGFTIYLLYHFLPFTSNGKSLESIELRILSLAKLSALRNFEPAKDRP